PADRERVERAYAKAMAGSAYECEYRVQASIGGAERWIESHGKGLCDEAGHLVRILGALRDATDRHRYDEFRRLLPGIVAHDLRSPLSTVKMAGVALMGSAALPATGGKYVRAILRGADAMARLTDQLLDVTQARFGGGIPLDRAPTDLAEVGREAVVAAQIGSPESTIDLDVDGDARGVWDRTRLGEVVSNLIGNAIKHGAPGKAIEVVVRDDGDRVVFAVHKHGVPIPEDLIPALFDPFRRAESAESHKLGVKSYGLGLYITREIVVAHGGTIDVRSSQEAGTTFSVRLPRGVHDMGEKQHEARI